MHLTMTIDEKSIVELIAIIEAMESAMQLIGKRLDKLAPEQAQFPEHAEHKTLTQTITAMAEGTLRLDSYLGFFKDPW